MLSVQWFIPTDCTFCYECGSCRKTRTPRLPPPLALPSAGKKKGGGGGTIDSIPLMNKLWHESNQPCDDFERIRKTRVLRSSSSSSSSSIEHHRPSQSSIEIYQHTEADRIAPAIKQAHKARPAHTMSHVGQQLPVLFTLDATPSEASGTAAAAHQQQHTSAASRQRDVKTARQTDSAKTTKTDRTNHHHHHHRTAPSLGQYEGHSQAFDSVSPPGKRWRL